MTQILPTATETREIPEDDFPTPEYWMIGLHIWSGERLTLTQCKPVRNRDEYVEFGVEPNFWYVRMERRSTRVFNERRWRWETKDGKWELPDDYGFLEIGKVVNNTKLYVSYYGDMTRCGLTGCMNLADDYVDLPEQSETDGDWEVEAIRRIYSCGQHTKQLGTHTGLDTYDLDIVEERKHRH